VPDLAERILSRTIYAQSASRRGPLRELVQNALDASPRGELVDIRTSHDGAEITITDRGRGMTRRELLSELLIPFESAKRGDPSLVGEHGIGFFSALELAPHVELTTVSDEGTSTLSIRPIGGGPPFSDFAFRITTAPASAWRRAAGTFARGLRGTEVRLALARAIPRSTLASEIASAAGLVDPEVLRIYVDGVLVNTARARLRRVARAQLNALGKRVGEIDLFVGRGAGIDPWLTIAQAGLFVCVKQDPFTGPELSLHRDLFRALTGAGYGIVAEIPRSAPLNKSRSGVASNIARSVELAVTLAFERFVLEDALFDRELLRAVDHRLASVLDRLVQGALGGELGPVTKPASGVDEDAPTLRAPSDGVNPLLGSRSADRAAPPLVAPTVAAPEEIVHFASALLETRAFHVSAFDRSLEQSHRRVNLREVLTAYRAGILRRLGDPVAPGFLYVDPTDPLAAALCRRLALTPPEEGTPPPVIIEAPPAEGVAPAPMQRLSRAALLTTAGHVPGTSALAAALSLIERVDGTLSQAAGLSPSPIFVHQDLYGPDEMAHTDGTGISVNYASARVRALITRLLASDDVTAFAALVDLIVHEKTHVSLASYVPKPFAEHGASFYRRKDLLRRQLLVAIDQQRVIDPIRWLATIRATLVSLELPEPRVLAAEVGSPRAAA
jgi:hypothetical protein